MDDGDDDDTDDDDTDDDTDDDHDDDDTDDDNDHKNDSYTAAGAAPGASVPCSLFQFLRSGSFVLVPSFVCGRAESRKEGPTCPRVPPPWGLTHGRNLWHHVLHIYNLHPNSV